MITPIGLAAVAGRLRSGRVPTHICGPPKRSLVNLTKLVDKTLKYVDGLMARPKREKKHKKKCQ